MEFEIIIANENEDAEGAVRRYFEDKGYTVIKVSVDRHYFIGATLHIPQLEKVLGGFKTIKKMKFVGFPDFFIYKESKNRSLFGKPRYVYGEWCFVEAKGHDGLSKSQMEWMLKYSNKLPIKIFFVRGSKLKPRRNKPPDMLSCQSCRQYFKPRKERFGDTLCLSCYQRIFSVKIDSNGTLNHHVGASILLESNKI